MVEEKSWKVKVNNKKIKGEQVKVKKWTSKSETKWKLTVNLEKWKCKSVKCRNESKSREGSSGGGRDWDRWRGLLTPRHSRYIDGGEDDCGDDEYCNQDHDDDLGNEDEWCWQWRWHRWIRWWWWR